MSDQIVWVYLVRVKAESSGCPPILPGDREFLNFIRDSEEKGLPVLLDNAFGDGLREGLQRTVSANYAHNQLGTLGIKIRSVIECRLLGKTNVPVSSIPTAFPTEKR